MAFADTVLRCHPDAKLFLQRLAHRSDMRWRPGGPFGTANYASGTVTCEGYLLANQQVSIRDLATIDSELSGSLVIVNKAVLDGQLGIPVRCAPLLSFGYPAYLTGVQK